MAPPLNPTLPPMEARLVETLPLGPQWRYEPKWDGFRCLAFRNADAIDLRSKSAQPLARYFPDVAAALSGLAARQFVLDGEILVPVKRRLSFEALQLRLHPAASRVKRLAAANPAIYVAFDLLLMPDDRRLTEARFAERRDALERFFAAERGMPALRLSPSVADPAVALGWLAQYTGEIDGIVAKRVDLPYLAGSRDGMQKFKLRRSADCVVGGFRYASRGGLVGSLLLGLYDEAGLLHHVGFTANLPAAEKPALTRRLEGLAEPPGFTGRAPGGPSRWSSERSAAWQPLRPQLVVEVRYDQVSDCRFRHGAAFLRWRPDKAPRQCGLDQLPRAAAASALALVSATSPKSPAAAAARCTTRLSRGRGSHRSG
jgi:ATP-dependent DNA ligase